MELLADLVRSLPFTLGVMAVILLVVLFEVGRRLALASELARHSLDDASRLEEAAENGEVAVVDLRTATATAPLRHSFQQVVRLLRQMLPGDRPRYQTPWFLSLGPTGAGKTTVLGHSHLVLPLGEPDSSTGTAPPGTSWWLFDRAVALDVSGDMVLAAQGTHSDQAAWRGLLGLLRRHRARRPADGVLLTLPASDLVGFEPQDPEAQRAIAERASVLRRKLVRAQQQLGMRLPVYVLVTKCDLVPGFERFVELLSADERRQIFGWSNPDPPESAYSGGAVDTAFASVDTALARFQLRAFGRRGETSGETGADSGAGGRAFVAFPAALAGLKEPLRITLNQIFSDSALAEPFPFRGLYFSGGTGFGDPDADSPHHLETAGGWAEPASGGLPSNAHRQVSFLADLFDGKLLYEWNLARPTAAAAKAASRRALAFRTLLLAGLVLGPVALWGGVRMSSTRAATLDQDLLTPLLDTSTRQGPAPSTRQLAEQAGLALDAAGKVPNYRLQTSLLPWGGRADRNLARAMTGVYEETVFPSTRRSIDRQLDQLAGPAVGAPEAGTILGVETTPEMKTLRARTDRVAELELDVDRYNCFSSSPCVTGVASPLDRFDRMISSVYRTDLRFPTREARSFYGDLLPQVRVAPYADEVHRTPLQQRTLKLSDAMFDRLFEDNVVSLDLTDLASQIERLTGHAPATDEVRDAYSRLLATIQRTRDDLARPEMAWIGAEKLELGDGFRAWLDDVRASRLLGPEVAIEILRRGAGDPRRRPLVGFAAFQDRMARYAEDDVTAIGPLLAATDGRIELSLSPQMQALEGALEGLLGEGFMAEDSGYAVRLEPPYGTALFWDPRYLDEATALYASFQSFTEEGLAGFEALRQVTGRAARESLEPLLLDRIARAQDFRELPDLFTKALRESHIVEQVANLQSVSASLNNLLQAFEAPPAAALAGDCAGFCTSRSATGWCQLAAILEIQQRDLMEQIDELLAAKALYTPRDGDFSWWQGTGDLALEAFGVATADDLSTYLASQQRQVKNLAEQYASPVLTGIETQDCWGYSAQPEIRRFKVILSDLADVESKTPNNAVALLEELVTTTLPQVTGDNCRTEVTARRTCFASATPVDLKETPPCDYFLDARLGLERGVHARCDELTVASARKAWGEITRSFNDRLSGKFPFTDEPAQPLQQEATDDDVVNFFRVFDRHHAVIDSFLDIAAERAGESPPPWDPKAVAAVRGFMDQVASCNESQRAKNVKSAEENDAAGPIDPCPLGSENQGLRAFFGPFLADRAKSPAAVPTFDLQVQFRVNRGNEYRANQIFDWRFQVDQTEIQPGEVDPPGRWTYGQPVSLALTWAAHAPTEPLRPAGSNVRVENRTVTYEWQKAWALVSLIKEHAAPPKDFTNFVDDDPVTLVFEIPTATVPVPSVAEKKELEKETRGGWRFWKRQTREPTVEPPPPGDRRTAEYTTKAFVRITLTTPDDAKAELPFPTFPTSVPAFP